MEIHNKVAVYRTCIKEKLKKNKQTNKQTNKKNTKKLNNEPLEDVCTYLCSKIETTM